MSLFGNKKKCPICGRDITGILNMQIKDKKAICKDCRKLISMDLNLIPIQTVEDIQEHLEYRKLNAEKLKDFKITREIEISNGIMLKKSYFRIDENNKMWYYVEENDINPPLFTYDSLIKYEIIEDGDSITKGGLGGAVVGGTLFGGTGAIVGSNIASKTNYSVIKVLKIKIMLNNKYHSTIEINILPQGESCKANSFSYNMYKKTISDITVLLDKILYENNKRHENIQIQNSLSSADEILKYKNLLDAGIISVEEFENAKEKLLNM